MTRPALRMLAFGYEVFTSSGLRHWARPTMSSHVSYCDRAGFGPLMADVISKIVFDHLRTNHDHRVSIAQNSNNWKSRPNGKAWLVPGRRKDFPEIRPSRVGYVPSVISETIFLFTLDQSCPVKLRNEPNL